jgi:hypothetical protein
LPAADCIPGCYFSKKKEKCEKGVGLRCGKREPEDETEEEKPFAKWCTPEEAFNCAWRAEDMHYVRPHHHT